MLQFTMRISFDLDDVLASFQLGWIEFNNSTYGTDFAYEDFVTFDYREIMGIDMDEVLKRIFKFYETDIFANLVPVEGSIDVVDKLKENHELVVLTSRPEEIMDLTRYWIKTNYDDSFLDVLTSAQIKRDRVETKKFTKADVCREYDIDIHIEDAAIYANDTSSAGVKTFLVEKPWNRNEDFLNENLYRIDSISDLIKQIKN